MYGKQVYCLFNLFENNFKQEQRIQFSINTKMFNIVWIKTTQPKINPSIVVDLDDADTANSLCVLLFFQVIFTGSLPSSVAL